jgi:hypothetical protein
MSDDVFLAQVLAGRFVRRAVNESKLFGPVQGADLLDLAVGLDQPLGLRPGFKITSRQNLHCNAR